MRKRVFPIVCAMVAIALFACSSGDDNASDGGAVTDGAAAGDTGGGGADGGGDGGQGDNGGPSWPAEKAYVLMEGDTVAVLDATDPAAGIKGTLELKGNGVSWIAAEGAKKRLYAANRQRNTFSAYETVTMSPLPGSPYAAGQMPVHVAIHQNHNLVVVTNSASHDLSVYESATMTQIPSSPLVSAGQSPAAVAIDDNESRAFIMNQGGAHDVTVYEVFGPDAWTLRPEKLPVGVGPVSLVADPPDRRLYVANAASNNVTAYDMDTLIQLDDSPYPAGKKPAFLAIDKAGGVLYAANTGDDLVTMYNAKTMQTIGSITMAAGSAPTSLSVDTARNRLYVAAGGDTSVHVYALDTAAPVGTPVKLPAKPINIDLD